MAFIRNKKPIKENIDSPSHGITCPLELIDFAQRKNIEMEPLDVARLTQELGIVMRMEPLKGDESGSLKKDKQTGCWIITVNSLHHPNRQRFTIAHELGHYIQHSRTIDLFEDKVFFRNGDMNTQETEANRFAAEILMPEQAFRDFIKNCSTQISDIADKFGVSSMAVRVRAKQLGYEGHNL